MTRMPAWVDDYRGRPFRLGARGPDAYDCYGLVRAVLRDRWNADVPALDGLEALGTPERFRAASAAEDDLWIAAEPPRPGDVLTFMLDGLHVGVVVAEGWMLHARSRLGVATSRYDQMPWAAVRVGPAYRHHALTDPVMR